MSESSTIPATPVASPAHGLQPPEVALSAFYTAGVFPATTATRTQHLSLKKAFAVHLCGALFTLLAIAVVVAITESSDPLSPSAIAGELKQAARAMAHEWSTHRYEMIAIVTLVTIHIEAAFLLLALWIMPWGARDEPIRASFRNALRQLWLHTAHLPQAVTILGVVIAGLLALKPWYIQEHEPMMVASGFLLACWVIFSVFRAVGANREVIPVSRPPLCERCGYNLTAAPMDGRCPECGTNVVDSLGEEVRPGSPWNNRGSIGYLGAWWKTSVLAIRRPDELGRAIRITGRSVDHRRFLAIHLPLIFLIGFGSLTLFVVTMMGFGAIRGLYDRPLLETIAVLWNEAKENFAEAPLVILSITTIFACCTTVGTVMFTHLIAAVVGLHYSRREKRNLLPGAIQIASYQVVFLVAWAVFGAISVLVVGVLGQMRMFDLLYELTGIYSDTFAFLTWFLPNVLWGLAYVLLVARGTVATRYANR